MDTGFAVWLFILIGNAIALIALSAVTAGGTSAMGSSSYTGPVGTQM